MAAFYAYESQVPRIAQEKNRGLRELYGADEKTCGYFTLHTSADVYHSQVWRQQLAKRIDGNPEAAVKALVAGEAAAKALWRALDIVLLIGLPWLAVDLWSAQFGLKELQWLGAGWVLALLWVRNLFRFYGRVAKSNFPFLDCAVAPLGLPLFIVLLYRSWFQHKVVKQVSWKGRTYEG